MGKTSDGEEVLRELIGREVGETSAKPTSIRLGSSSPKYVTPDIGFTDEKIAVFYDGCYWHECPTHRPDSRGGTILVKDRSITAKLTKLGWYVARFWEHEDVALAAREVARVVRERRAAMAQERHDHVAAHDLNAWCRDCAYWPHKPWPVDPDSGDCLRCDEYGDHHNYTDNELATLVTAQWT